jgi:hypothetical protein
MKKTPWTLTQHQELGRRLRTIERELMSVCRLLVEHYGKTNKSFRLAFAVLNKMQNVFCELDSQAFNDIRPKLWSEESQAVKDCYYGGKS